MANTINDLYLKYVNKVGKTLENDRYFQYMFEMVQAGSNEFQQKNQILHKVVDEKWLATIEESLDAISTIIEKPRRFVTTNEEVVPVALARKISADSVRHLSMNTQFIASSEDGDIQPTRILNVSTEETYDLYENRFIYHLIQRLVTFIDKRTDVIFWQTGDEKANTLLYQSKVEDAYEEIDYKVEMTIKNRQNFAENDTDNMSVFMRIDRVRRLVMALRKSSFCDIMAGCSKVRSPIQRTNLIMKDPQYRTCYKLWQFLESYDDVGYTIEVLDSAMEFDEEYLLQMYTNLITNYMVFKSLLEDTRRLEMVDTGKKKRVIKPKFIKKIEEQIVESRDIEDVEIRKVFVEEVTQAQLDAEEKLATETAERERLQQEMEDLDGQMLDLQQQVSNLMMMHQEAEIRAEEERQARELAAQEADEVNEAYKELEASMEALQEELRQAKASEEEMKQSLLEAQNREESARLLATRCEEERNRAVEEARSAVEKMETSEAAAKQRIEEIQKESEEKMSEVRSSARRMVEEIQNDAETKVAQEKEAAQQLIAQEKESAKQLIAKEQEISAKTVSDEKERAKQAILEEQEKAQKSIAFMKEQTEEQIASMKEQTEEQIASIKMETDKKVELALQEKQRMQSEMNQAMQLQEESYLQMQEAKKEAQEAMQREQAARQAIYDAESRAVEAGEARVRAERLAQEAQQRAESAMETARVERQKAEEALLAKAEALQKAEANTLSHYIISAFKKK